MVAGGGSDSAQIFDPAKNSWNPVELPVTKNVLNDATATLLENGKVLFFRGKGGQLYDPEASSWKEVPPSPSEHGEHTATLLPDGKVLVAGGLGQEIGTSAVDVYDPAANKWTATRPLNELRYQHSAVALRDGKVLVAGGFSHDYGPKRSSVEIYDPAKKTWGPAASLKAPYAPTAATATLLSDGKVLLAGGQSTGQGPGGEGGDKSAQIYDPANNTWAEVATMAAGRSRHTATRLSDDKVLLAGGTTTISFPADLGGRNPADAPGGNLGPAPTQTAEIYDRAANTWTPVPMGRPRSSHTATPLVGPKSSCGENCGKILIAGGRTAARPDLPGDTGTTAELFAPAGANAVGPEVGRPVEKETSEAGSKKEKSGLPAYVLGGIAAGVLLMALLVMGLRRKGRA